MNKRTDLRNKVIGGEHPGPREDRVEVASGLEGLKARLREEVRARLSGMSRQARQDASLLACALLRRQTNWQQMSSLFSYAPMEQELDVWPLVGETLSSGKLVALPYFDKETGCYVARRVKNLEQDLEVGRYGVREPKQTCEMVPLNRLDFVLVPGVAFDVHGRRLGRGRGHYDRLLATVRGQTCGVAFDEQIVRQVPVGPHDSDVNCILTPRRWIEL